VATLHGGVRVRGKRVGRGLLLAYASLGLGGALRAAARAAKQVFVPAR